MRKLIQISGAGHSGSTLLGAILGNLNHSFYMGEAKKIMNIGNSNKPLRKRTCKICGEECERWKGFQPTDHQQLFNRVSDHMSADILIDSTKDIGWITSSANYASISGFESCLIFLYRDGRAVVNSRIRKYPNQEPVEIIRNWQSKIKETSIYFEQFKGPKIKVDYDDLTTDPESTLEQICQSFGMNFDNQALNLSDAEQHPFGGNNGTQYLLSRGSVELQDRVKSYYANHSGGIEPDLRWKHELSAENLSLFESMVNVN